MPADILTLLLEKVSYSVLFVVLFWWTLRESGRRETRYLTLLDVYGKQLEVIAATLSATLSTMVVIQRQTEHLVKTRGNEVDN